MHKTLVLGAALAAATLTPSVARADLITGTGATGSSFSADFTYSFTDDAHGTVDITLDNTTPDAIGGFLTAFVFNLPDGAAVTLATLTASVPNFQVIGGPTFDNAVNGAPYGQFDIGASTFTSFEGGGPPSNGIPTTTTGTTFSFALTGSGLSGLTAASFLSTLSVPPGDGSGHESFLVRFRGLADGGSDKVPGEPGTPIPEPGTAMLIGLGLASLAARRRARRP